MAGRHKIRLRPGIKLATAACLYCLFMGGLSYGIYSGYRHLHRSPFFFIDQVIFEGTSLRTEPALRQIFADVRGRNLLGLDLLPYQEKALRHKWIGSIVIHRQLPNILRVKLTERQPVGLCQFHGEILLFDGEGSIIDTMSSGQTALDTPILKGVREESLKEDLLFGFQFLSDLKAENQMFWENMEEIDIKDRENIIAFSSLIRAPVFLGRHPEPGNLSRFLSIVPFINKNYPELEYVELGVSQQVVIMPRGGNW